MKKAFFKYFISIFSITVVTLLLQSVILVVQYSHSQTKWKTSVYNDFVDALEESIESGRFKDFGLGSLRLIMSTKRHLPLQHRTENSCPPIHATR